ncbi:TRAP transporter permease [Sediminivirga luteola]|uniref:C4-dicarboxylate ABC transporter n=1 Tax=Sediminivirga luteola TaxID=1774748 RepID=A0A8J2TWS9_9MICO|nr:TRAP transporter permease [Sediminivirga luteola]MCI2263927.1 TRAP transporter permease [Sediminivirga luteola]GGA08747.1 C4-dicarboxylate ABC transporter [Sediminivirga luteola]
MSRSDKHDPAQPAAEGETIEVIPHDEDERRAREKEAAAAAAKYDAESRVRETRWKPLALLISGVAVFTALYHMYTAYFGTPPTLIHRSLHVSLILFLVFMLYPPARRARAAWWRIPDAVLALAAFVPTLYLVQNYEQLVLQAGRYTSTDILVATLLVVLVLEAARRVTGWALPILALLFILFGLYGRELPGLFRHRGYDWDTLAYNFFATTEGIFGTAIGVSATYIFLFILFGAFLAKSGMSQMFNDLALAIAGQGRGGPAKVATLASGFMGSINGAAIANVVSTGAFTIPLMKKIGYTRTFAGAVESTASVGGQILPPIMGAAAFIMAETLGVPYTTVALAAIVPALLYYVSLIGQIHLRATRMGLKGIAKENLPDVLGVLKDRGHLLIPLAFLLYMLFFSGRTILYSAFLTILVTIAVAMLRKTTRMTPLQILQALEDGTRSALGVAVACASVGVIVGVVTVSGFGVTLAGAIVSLSGGVLFWTLVMTMVACLVLGMGLPSIPAYIITATMAAPALTELGVEPIVAHLFVFYFGLFANITPPVALASFAAAGISGGSPMRTGVASLKLASAGFVIPYIFVYNPDLLLRDVDFLTGVTVVASAVVAVLLLATAIEGHFMVDMPWYARIVIAAGALMMLNTNMLYDLIGIGLVVLVLGFQMIRARAAGQLSLRAI